MLVGLLAAVVWGTGDFTGGLATRGRNPYHVLALASVAGMICLGIVAVLLGEAWPAPATLLWSASAGISGGIGIAALYKGLSVADAAVVSPPAAVIGAVLPVVVGATLHGRLSANEWGGIAAGLAGIWLVTGGSVSGWASGAAGLRYAVPAGIGFGGFFVFIAQAPIGQVFAPLVVAKAVAVLLALLVVTVRGLGLPSLARHRLAFVAGVLDAAGNVLYLLAAQLTRFEIAAVISSMAPGATVVLATLISRQAVSISQKVGVGMCLLAIALILI